MKLIDAHLHLWNPARLDYPWLESAPAVNKSFSIHDYQRATGVYHPAKMVFVQGECQPEQALDELNFRAGAGQP